MTVENVQYHDFRIAHMLPCTLWAVTNSSIINIDMRLENMVLKYRFKPPGFLSRALIQCFLQFEAVVKWAILDYCPVLHGLSSHTCPVCDEQTPPPT